MCLCVSVWRSVCMIVFVCVFDRCVYKCMCVCIGGCVCVYEWMYLCVYKCVCVCVHKDMGVCVCVCVCITSITSPFCHYGDGSLLPAGSSPEETLVLVGVSIRATHWDELLMTLHTYAHQHTHIDTQIITRTQEHTYTNTQINTHAHMDTHTHIPTHKHTYKQNT